MSTFKNKKPSGESSQAGTEETKENFPHGFETETVRMSSSPYHKKGQEVTLGKAHAQRLIKKGWAEALMIAVLCLSMFTTNGQSQSFEFFNSTYTTKASDTVTNTGTAVLQCSTISGGGTTTAIVARVLEISGTTGGTITLQGCVKCDGTDWKAMNQPNSTTALGTHTATDVADNNYHWWLTGSPERQYRISYTGTGTMAARIFGWGVKK